LTLRAYGRNDTTLLLSAGGGWSDRRAPESSQIRMILDTDFFTSSARARENRNKKHYRKRANAANKPKRKANGR